MRDKRVTLPQVKGRVEQMSDKVAREKMRPKLVKAMKRLDELLESKNDSISFASVKLVINKFIPDLRVSEFQVEENRRLGVVILPPLDNEVDNKHEK
jgi:hypothetical protein